jgi:hypothetical protein
MDIAFRLTRNLREDQQQRQESQHGQRHEQSDGGIGRLGAPEIVPALQEKRTDPNAERQPRNPDDGVEVSAREAEKGAPGASEEHEGADHGEQTENEPGDGRRSGSGAELPEQQGGRKRPQHEADDLGPQVLDHLRSVKTQGARHIPLEAGDTDSHVGRVPQFLQNGSQDADQSARKNDPLLRRENIFHMQNLRVHFCARNYQ